MIGMINNSLKRQRGFTLVELVLVLGILAFLVGLALINNSGGMEDEAKDIKMQADFSSLATAIKVYQVKQHNYPASLNALTASVSGGYQAMISEEPTDPYNTVSPYRYGYTSTATSATISSASGESRTVR